MVRSYLEKGVLLKHKINFIRDEFGIEKEKEIYNILQRKFNISLILPAQWYEENIVSEILNFIIAKSHFNKAQKLKKLGEYIAEKSFRKNLQSLYSGFSLEQKVKMLLTTFSTLWYYEDISVRPLSVNRVELSLHSSSKTQEDVFVICGFFEKALELTDKSKISVSCERKEQTDVLIVIESGSPTDSENTMEIYIENENQIVEARQKAKYFAEKMGFKVVDVTRIITCVSELARNIVYYAGNGYINLKEETEGNKKILILQSVDRGPGIKNLDEILEGNYKSEKGLGMGLRVVKRLSDDVKIDTEVGKGTKVELKYYLNQW